jgi:hypothetical protein
MPQRGGPLQGQGGGRRGSSGLLPGHKSTMQQCLVDSKWLPIGSLQPELCSSCEWLKRGTGPS